MLYVFDLIVEAATTGLTTRDFIGGLLAAISKDPKTVYYGTILANMKITVIADMNTNYSDPSPESHREPEFIRVYMNGHYDPNDPEQKHAWCTHPTMAVDPVGNIYIGEQFIYKDLFPEFEKDPKTGAPTAKRVYDVIIAILLHESMHISGLTFFRGKGKEWRIWNIATDAYINKQLIQNGYELPKDCIKPDKDGSIHITVKGEPGVPDFEYLFDIKDKTEEILYEDLKKILRPDSEPPSPPGPPPPPKPLQRGDPVFMPTTGKYGVIIDIKKPLIREITEEEAKQRARDLKQGIKNI